MPCLHNFRGLFEFRAVPHGTDDSAFRVTGVSPRTVSRADDVAISRIGVRIFRHLSARAYPGRSRSPVVRPCIRGTCLHSVHARARTGWNRAARRNHPRFSILPPRPVPLYHAASGKRYGDVDDKAARYNGSISFQGIWDPQTKTCTCPSGPLTETVDPESTGLESGGEYVHRAVARRLDNCGDSQWSDQSDPVTVTCPKPWMNRKRGRKGGLS